MDTDTARAAFAAELARRRADAELSLGKLAGLAHASRGYLHHIERGRRWIRRELLDVASHYDQFAAWMAQDTIGPRGCDQALRPGNGGGPGDR